jgi:hypothetical protein
MINPQSFGRRIDNKMRGMVYHQEDKESLKLLKLFQGFTFVACQLFKACGNSKCCMLWKSVASYEWEIWGN